MISTLDCTVVRSVEKQQYDKMENKIYHNAGKVLNFQPKNVETGTKLIQ
jgi:hypothetical protein